MGKLTLIILSVISINTAGLCQSGWFWQNPLPQGNHIRDMKVFDASYAIALDKDNLLKTSDGGSNWQLVFTGIPRPNISFFMINSNTGFLVVDSTTVLKTINGGLNWNFLSQIGSVSNSRIYFVNSDTGFIYGPTDTYQNGAKILRTTNGGLSWTPVLQDTGFSISSMQFISSSNGYMIGTKWFYNFHLKFFRTTNAGASWDTIANTINEQGRELYFINNTGFIALSSKIYKTTNGGVNWLQVLSNGGDKIQMFDVNNTYILSSNGLYKTSNSGMNWSLIFIPYAANFTNGFSFINMNTGFCYGAGGFIVRTLNAGTNWTLHLNGTQKWIDDVVFFNSSTGIASGDNGALLRTTNGGANWVSNDFSFQTYLLSLSKIDSVSLYMVDYRYGTLYKTTDRGLTWDSLNAQLYLTWRLQFVNSSTGYVVEKSGRICKTTNGGINWTTVMVSTNFAYALYFVDANTGYAGTDPLKKTTDGGENWSNMPEIDEYTIYDVQFVNANTGFAGCQTFNTGTRKAFVGRTRNAGVNWEFTDFGPGYVDDIYFLNESTGFFIFDGRFFKTTNGGDNWYETWTCVYDTYISSMYFTDNNTGYAVGYGGVIIKTTTGGGSIIGVNPHQTDIPKNFILYQNYPNPFNPLTTIKYELPKDGNISLTIYDILGREVYSISEFRRAGSYEFRFDGENLASGLYYYRMESNGFIETKKMVLIK